MNKKIELGPMLEQIAKIDEELANPLPTPPVASMVVWYPRADIDPENQIAGIVTKVEGPGKLTLTVFRPQGMADATRRGCLHIEHSIHENRHNAVSQNSGAWEYPDWVEIPDSHYDLHRDQLMKKKESVQKQIAEAEEVSKKQETAAEQKKPVARKTSAKKEASAQSE